MMTELLLVEGVSDVQLISYYLQNVYGWKHIKENDLGVVPVDQYEHIESLSNEDNQIVLCGVGGNGKISHFIEVHRLHAMIVEKDISSIMIVVDRDEESVAKIGKRINNSFEAVRFKIGEWTSNEVTNHFGQNKNIDSYLLIVPASGQGALEKVIINALDDIKEEHDLIHEVTEFIDSLKLGLVPELTKMNKANKAAVGTYFSVRDPQNAMRSFGVFISKVNWAESQTLKELFAPFQFLGKDKPKNK